MTIRAVHIEIAHSLDADVSSPGEAKFKSYVLITELTSQAENVSCENQFKHGITIRFMKRCCKETSNGLSILLTDCICSIRRILCALLLEETTDDEGLTTLMCDIESILNSHPITVVSEDSRDLEPLMPNHLLLLKSDTMMPPGVFQKKDLLSRCRWSQVQYLSDIFWKRCCLLYTSPSPRDGLLSRMPSSA